MLERSLLIMVLSHACWACSEFDQIHIPPPDAGGSADSTTSPNIIDAGNGRDEGFVHVFAAARIPIGIGSLERYPDQRAYLAPGRSNGRAARRSLPPR